MASSSEIVEILNAEQYVDLNRLKSAARHGIPPSIRGEVWLYLLDVLPPDRSNEITYVRSKYASYTSLDKKTASSGHIRLECSRYYNRRLLPLTRRTKARDSNLLKSTQNSTSAASTEIHQLAANLESAPPPTPVDTNIITEYIPLPTRTRLDVEEHLDLTTFTTSVENILCAYLNRNRHVEYEIGFVHLAAPFVWTLKTEAGMYFCFEKLQIIIEENSALAPLPWRISYFFSLFRQLLPDLYSYFEEEAVDMREIASSWLQWLLAKETQMPMLARLWDVYFAIKDVFEFHYYVCLAILLILREVLEELDQSEIRSVLLSLPLLDVDRIVLEAHNLRLTYKQVQTRGDTPADFDY